MVEQIHEGARIQAGPDARLSVWAMMSVVVSLLVCCPVLTMVGPLLGWKALQDMKAMPLRGRGLAKAGIGIGVVTTAMSLGAFAWLNVNVRGPMLAGPRFALQQGLEGDVAGFKRSFLGSAAQEPNEVAARFLSEVSRRYGRLRNSRQDKDNTREAVGTVGSGLTVPYVFQFDSGTVRVEGKMEWGSQSGFMVQFSSIVIIDPDRGDIAFPPDATSLAGPESGDATSDEPLQENDADQ